MKLSLAFVAILALTGAARAGPVIKSSSELHDVFEEFLELVPVEPINSIVAYYLEHDPEIKLVLEYMTGEEFKNLVAKVESIEDVIKFYDYLQASGLDIYGAVNQLHGAIGLPPLVPGKPTGLRTAHGGIAGLVTDIKAVLPLEDIKALYYNKLETSPAFAHLVARLSSPKFQKLIDALRANEEFRKIVGLFHAAGLDIAAITDLMTTLFGLEFPTRTEELEKELIDFIAILPLEAIQKIQQNYIDNDPEFEEIGRYVQTEEFAQKLQELESIKEVKVLINFLQGSGLNVHGFLEVLHDALEIPPFEPTSLARKTSGLAGYVAEIKAILPTKEIKALHQDKLQNSPAFRHLSKRLASPEFHYTVAAVREHAQASSIIAVFKSHGINFVVAADLFASIFGFQ